MGRARSRSMYLDTRSTDCQRPAANRRGPTDRRRLPPIATSGDPGEWPGRSESVRETSLGCRSRPQVPFDRYPAGRGASRPGSGAGADRGARSSRRGGTGFRRQAPPPPDSGLKVSGYSSFCPCGMSATTIHAAFLAGADASTVRRCLRVWATRDRLTASDGVSPLTGRPLARRPQDGTAGAAMKTAACAAAVRVTRKSTASAPSFPAAGRGPSSPAA